MRKVFFQISIALLTFLFGTFAALIVPALKQASLNHDPTPTVEHERLSIPAAQKRQFFSTFRACKPGYVQGYETEDGQQLREGVRPVADNAWGSGYDQRIRAARRPRTYVRHYVDAYGKVGERYILENESKDGEQSVTILSYGGGDSYKFIDAPTLDLALEFEQYLFDSDLSRTEKYRVLR